MDGQQKIFAEGVQTTIQELLVQNSFVMHERAGCEYEFVGKQINVFLGYTLNGPYCSVSIPREHREYVPAYKLYHQLFGAKPLPPNNAWSASESIEWYNSILEQILTKYNE